MISQKWKTLLPCLIVGFISSCSTSAPGINHLLDEQYHKNRVPVSMKVDIGPFANKQFHYSELGTAAGINQRIVMGKYFNVELFENINLNPQAGLSVSGFRIGHDFSAVINGYVATCVLGNRKKTIAASGNLSEDFAMTEYCPLLYGVQSRIGRGRYFIGIDFLRNSLAYDPRVITKKIYWDYLVDRHFFDKNPQPENFVIHSLKFSGVVNVPAINMTLSLYYLPPVQPFKGRVGIEISYMPLVD
jgi:hypothetical protein